MVGRDAAHARRSAQCASIGTLNLSDGVRRADFALSAEQRQTVSALPGWQYSAVNATQFSMPGVCGYRQRDARRGCASNAATRWRQLAWKEM